MFEELARIANFIGNAFIHIWPYLLVTIPLAVAVQMSDASRHIEKALSKKPAVAIFLATAVGAFSPFCSCGVIPVIAALLIGGVPLAPVMSFWLASPSMDPEIFFLSVATVGWDLAIWRIAATFVMSLGAGFLTHAAMESGWLEEEILLRGNGAPSRGFLTRIKRLGRTLNKRWGSVRENCRTADTGGTLAISCCGGGQATLSCVQASLPPQTNAASSDFSDISRRRHACEGGPAEPGCGGSRADSFGRRLWREASGATWMVVKFMGLAFFLEALIILYVPSEWIVSALGRGNRLAIPMAALLGVPVYTSNLAALPMIGGLLEQGMHPSAALSFLIAGPTTTLPAMAAVWTLVKRRIFMLYISFSLLGALLAGYLFRIAAVFF